MTMNRVINILALLGLGLATYAALFGQAEISSDGLANVATFSLK